jgi:hypothetical protein
MASEIEICNIALGRIKVSRQIAALDEGSVEADQCARFYANARDNVLVDFAWGFANRYVALGLVAEDPSPEWAFAYRYPTDCLRARYLVTGTRPPQPPIAFELGNDDSGLLLYTNQPEALLKYTVRITNTELFSPDFADLVAWRLAPDLAIPLGRDKTTRAEALQAYQDQLVAAQVKAANEEQLDEAPEAESIRGR